MNYNQVLSYLSSLTQTVNSIISNSKKIEELPEQITIVPSSEIHVSESGTSKRLKVSKIVSLALSLFQNNVNDKFTTIGTITRNENEFTFDGFEAIIGGETVTMLTSETITIEEAADGFKRIDIAVLNSLGHVVLIYGQESETIALQPTIPTGTLLITTWNIDGNQISDNTNIIVSDFVKKSFSAHFAFNGSGVDASIPLNPNGYSEIRVANPALESIAGVDLSLISGNPTAEVPYTGKIYLLRNITGNTITIKHNSAIADIPFYTNDEQNLEVPNKGIIIFTYDNGACDILLTNFSVGTANNFPYREITKTELDTLIANSQLTKGFYKISGVNPTLYGGTTILVEVLEDNKLPIDAYGLFYNPKYDKTIDGYGVAKDYAIWKDESEQLESGVYAIGANVIWGGKHWICIAETYINTKYIVDKYNLSADYFEEVPFDNIDYNLVLDKIKYDYEHDLIIERNEKNSNVVSFSYDSLTFLSSLISEDLALDNPIKNFQWGNVFDYDLSKGIGNNEVYDSLNENINFTGAYQIGLYFIGNNNQSRLIFKNTASQSNLYFSTQSRQTNLIFENESYQDNLTFRNNSYQNNLIFRDYSRQTNLIFGNGSYQNGLILNNFRLQQNLVFNNYGRYNITIIENEENLTFDGNKQATKLTANQFFTGKTTNDFAQIGDIPDTLALGETASTAYRGDRGKIAYIHSQATGNPHNTTKSDIGLGNVDNTSDLNKPISNATQNALNLKLSIESPSTTGTLISFTVDKVYGTLTTPETVNITADVTNAKLGVTNIIIHNSGTAPTFGSQFKKLSGSGNYVVGVVNYIYCTFITATEIIYSINQRS